MTAQAEGDPERLAGLWRSAQNGNLPPDALVELFEIGWAVLGGLPWEIQSDPRHGDAKAALAALEEPLRALISAVEDGAFDNPTGMEGTLARQRDEDGAERARDMNREFRDVA